MTSDTIESGGAVDPSRWLSTLDYLFDYGQDVGETVPTRIRPLDAALGGGLAPGLWAIVAAPGAGKTAFCLQIAFANAFFGTRAAFVSLESPAPEILWRLCSAFSRTKPAQDAGVTPFEWASVRRLAADTARRMAAEGLTVSEAASFDPFVRAALTLTTGCEGAEWIRDGADRRIPLDICGASEVRDLEELGAAVRDAASRGARLVVVDYLQLIRTGQERAYDRVTATTAALRDLANELGLVIAAPVSANRDANKSERLGMFGGAGSGSIEYDAVGVLTLETDEADRDKSPRPVTLTVHKNRFGPAGAVVELKFDPQYSRFD